MMNVFWLYFMPFNTSERHSCNHHTSVFAFWLTKIVSVKAGCAKLQQTELISFFRADFTSASQKNVLRDLSGEVALGQIKSLHISLSSASQNSYSLSQFGRENHRSYICKNGLQ